MIDPAMTGQQQLQQQQQQLQQHQGRKSITFNVTTASLRQKTKGGLKSNKCLYCGADIKASSMSSSSSASSAFKAEGLSKKDNNNSKHDIKQMRKKRNLNLWHKTRYWYFKNRKPELSGCQCGANGEFELKNINMKNKKKSEKKQQRFYLRFQLTTHKNHNYYYYNNSIYTNITLFYIFFTNY